MKFPETKVTITTLLMTVLATILLFYLFYSSVAERRLQELELLTKVQISEQETVLTSIAETTARGGADAVTEAIVKDCSLDERRSFDELLGSLNNGLSRSQLVELERLFGRCGSFFAERKSVMVSRLSREIEVYNAFVEQLSAITEKDEQTNYMVSEWQTLAESEIKQSELFAELVVVQDQIITTLLDGKSANSEEIQSILQTANEVQESLLVAGKQTSNIRSELIGL